jgi:hypothetical protein
MFDDHHSYYKQIIYISYIIDYKRYEELIRCFNALQLSRISPAQSGFLQACSQTRDIWTDSPQPAHE